MFGQRISSTQILLIVVPFLNFLDLSGGAVDDKCPKLTTVNCQVDCSSDTSWDFICVDHVDWSSLHDDLQRVDHFMAVNLWNLNNSIIQLESNIFGAAIQRIQRINLMNITGLQVFPMLRGNFCCCLISACFYCIVYVICNMRVNV